MSHEIEKDWITKAGLRAIVLVCIFDNRKSHRCGYVGVPPLHKLYGIEYNKEIDLPQELFDNQTLGKKSPILILTACVVDGEATDRIRKSPDILFDVHGGLTYSGDGKNDYPVKGNEWWFGFDCNHCDDANIEPYNNYRFNIDGHVWQLEEVIQECESLAEQIIKINNI